MTAPRPIPDNFVEVYLERGWDGLQYIFNTHNSTIARWIRECGGEELRAKRAGLVSSRRRHGHVTGRIPGPVVDGVVVDEDVQRAAAQYLRHRHGGGWMVSATGNGDWRIGTMRKSPAGLVDFAVGKGFDPSVISMSRLG